ncbi:MAG TPA: pantetheine-phosphate adenylyltransferase [Candidatus Omnitrophica bacterium]|nr:pantetheine-phosphate adenylyltransferase [Candidatus Omnitrophota bacterium]
MEKRIIYPGTFDPVTLGHLDLMKRAAKIFDKLTIAVAKNLQKKHLFSLDERLHILREATRGMENVEIDHFDGLLVEYARRKKSHIILRGIRAISDFEYEFQMALSNRKLAPEIETIFMMPSENYSYLSSKIIKEVASLGADLSGFVPAFVEKRLKEKLASKKKVDLGNINTG